MGTFIRMAGSFCYPLLRVWQGTHDWTWLAISLLMVDQDMLVWAVSNLNNVLMTMWSACKQFDLNIAGMKNLHSHVMQECYMVRSSFSCQKGLRTTGRLLGVFWIHSTCTLVWCALTSWKVTFQPFVSTFSYGLLQVRISAICNLCMLGGTTLRCSRWKFLRGLWSLWHVNFWPKM